MAENPYPIILRDDVIRTFINPDIYYHGSTTDIYCSPDVIFDTNDSLYIIEVKTAENEKTRQKMNYQLKRYVRAFSKYKPYYDYISFYVVWGLREIEMVDSHKKEFTPTITTQHLLTIRGLNEQDLFDGRKLYEHMK